VRRRRDRWVIIARTYFYEVLEACYVLLSKPISWGLGRFWDSRALERRQSTGVARVTPSSPVYCAHHNVGWGLRAINRFPA